MGRGKIMGPILIAVGVMVCLGASLFMLAGMYSGRVSITGAVLGIVLMGLFPLAIFGGVGAYLVISGRKEAEEIEVIRKKERILGLIQAQGQASLSVIMLEMSMNREQVTNAIYELVSMGLFSGYIDWDKMEFYSKDASVVGSNQCPNCGGTRELVGKGVVKCPYCGVALFVPQDAPQTRAEPKPPENG